MNAAELRIGNWVTFMDEEVAVDGEGIAACSRHSVVDAIPLTEEWLVRLGFEKKEDGYYFVPGWAAKFDFEPSRGLFFNYGTAGINVRMSSVHQLQNFFFCLCGEELKIKA